MEILLRRLLGLYFLIMSFGYIPAALSYLGVGNAYGPWWVLPVVPLSQAVIFSVAGLILLRRSADAVSLGAGMVFPPVDSLLQLVGVYFIVIGLGSAVAPAVNMLFVGETWVARVGNFAAAVVWVAGGLFLVTRPQAVLNFLTRYRTA